MQIRKDVTMMKRKKYSPAVALIICVLFVCALCFAAFAEGTDPASEYEAVPEEAAVFMESPEDSAGHCLWGFFTAWASEDTERMLDLCSFEWKKGKEDPEQALGRILETGKPLGYKISSLSEEDDDGARTAGVILQRGTDNGGYTYSLYGITFRPEPDGFYTIDPDGIGEAGTPAEPVPEEEMMMLTAEGIIRSSLELHEEEGIYEKLVPINEATEKQGIRVEVISGFVRGRKACFLISMQDTEGRYDGYRLEPSFADNIDGSYARGWSELYYDAAERKSYYFVTQNLDMQMQPEECSVKAGISEVWIRAEKRINLLPLLQEYGKAEEGINLPALSRNREEPAVPEDERVLDYRNPLEIPLYKDVSLTGIGWINGLLHVQVHNSGKEFIEMRNGRGSACSAWVNAGVSGRSYWETSVDYSPLSWDGDSDGWDDWNEFIISCGPEETEKLELRAEISITDEILENNWSVLIPLDRICTATDEEPENTEEAETVSRTDDDAEDYLWTQPSFLSDYTDYRLWEFFCYWAQADMDHLPDSLTSEARYGSRETNLPISKLLEEGTPLAYQVNSVTGTDGNTVRQYACTVLMDPGSGKEPQCRRYEIGMKHERWWYCVDPESLTCAGPAEMDPEKQTISLSAEAVISDNLDYYHPGVREQLLPVGVSCESNGIRMELVSGLVKDNEAWYIYSLQDPEGRYDDYSPEVFDLRENAGTTNTFSTAVLYRDRKEHKVYMIWNPHYAEPVKTRERSVTMSLDYLFFSQNVRADLIPLLQQYGENAQCAKVPEDARDRDFNVPENQERMKVLDYTRPLDISLSGNTSVSGIGWIDGQLHIQLRISGLISWSAGISAFLSEDTGFTDVEEVSYSPLEWFTEDGEWYEYVFDCKPEDAENLKLYFDGTVGRERLQGSWKIQFPLSAVCPDAAGTEEE